MIDVMLLKQREASQHLQRKFTIYLSNFSIYSLKKI